MELNRSTCALAISFMVAGLLLGWTLESGFNGPLRAQNVDPERTPLSRAQEYEQLDNDLKHIAYHAEIVRRVVKLSSPFVVHIEARKPQNPNAQRSRLVEEAGSGIIIRQQNRFHVLTNRHVVKDAANDKITIHLDDGRECHPVNVFSDADTDIAVMAIDEANLISARLGNSDSVEIGDFVLAVGSPFGLSRSVTYGIISAKGRRDLELGGDAVRYQDFLQTDAAINPGNSGGPLLNMKGEVIGLNTAIASSSGGNEGIGFSIPINMALVVGRQLIENGMVRRAFLGVNLDAKFTAAMAAQLGLPRRTGARVTAVTPDSPAAQADIRVGDVILEFNNIGVQDDVHLVNLVSLATIDSEVPLIIQRDGRRIQLKLKVVGSPGTELEFAL